jgi:hypothetical protein
MAMAIVPTTVNQAYDLWVLGRQIDLPYIQKVGVIKVGPTVDPAIPNRQPEGFATVWYDAVTNTLNVDTVT